MVLPEAEHAVVDAAKVRDYLLSHEHAIGRFKAVFFETLGYKRLEWARLQVTCSLSAAPVTRSKGGRARSARSTRSVVPLRGLPAGRLRS